ncbi:MAG: hypothetical protein Q8P20_03755 [bacterium]|nr:hypothetical protein [bacterium]
MIKASSLLYAIFVCLIVSLLCGGLVIIFNLQFSLKEHFLIEEDLINTSYNHRLLILEKLGNDISLKQGEIVSEENFITTNYKVTNWGNYNILKMVTSFKKDTIYKNILFGSSSRESYPAVYVTDAQEPLYIGGNTKINGEIKVSIKGIKPGYLNNQNFIGTLPNKDQVGLSKNSLPKLDITNSIIPELTIIKFAEEVDNSKIYNSFHKPTILLKYTGITNIENTDLAGNIIIESQDSIHIKKSSNLLDVIIKAPSVSFEEGFEGRVQVFAEKNVFLSKEVKLMYPSCIHVKSDNLLQKNKIFLDENSVLVGAIILDDANVIGVQKTIDIEKKAILYGDIYCKGKIQLNGKIFGSVYTNKFYYQTDSGLYDNYIIDGEIDIKKLPIDFIGVPLFTENNLVYEIIKEL